MNLGRGAALPCLMSELFGVTFSLLCTAVLYSTHLCLSKGLAVIRPSISTMDSCICRCSGALIPVKGTATSSIQGHAPSSVTLRQTKSGDQTTATFSWLRENTCKALRYSLRIYRFIMSFYKWAAYCSSLSKPSLRSGLLPHKKVGGQSSGHLQFPAGTSSGLLEEHKSNKDLLRVENHP